MTIAFVQSPRRVAPGKIAMRLSAVAMFFAAAVAHAQTEPPTHATAKAADWQEPTDEVIVRGKRSVFRLRMELQAARENVWETFNAINSDDDFDIACNDAARTGSRITKRTCRPQYSDRATREAGRELARRLKECVENPNPKCWENAMWTSTGMAQEQIARIATMDTRMDQEFQDLARTHPELAAAILDYQAKERAYTEAVRKPQD